MRTRYTILLAGTLLVAVVIGVYAPWQARSSAGAPRRVVGLVADPADKDDKGDMATRVARDAITLSARAFEKAYAKGDAKAVAAFWTEGGEYHGDGVELRGRAAIEKAFADLFKHKPKAKIEIEIQSIRFLSPDTAVEDGIVRTRQPGAELPTSSRYSTLHVRSGDDWKVAVSREYGADEYKLDELGWLVGKWSAKVKGREIQQSFQWDENKTFLRNTFTVKEDGKTTWSGTQVIGMDPKTGQLRSWLFDADGGNGQSLWLRDGNRWLIDSVGELPDGTDTASVNVLTRLGDDEILWRSIDRVAGNTPLPDSDPIKLTRVK